MSSVDPKSKTAGATYSEPQLLERNKALSTLLEMSRFLSTSLELTAVLDGALLKVMEYFDFTAGRIYLMEEKGHFLSLVAHRGVDITGLERLRVGEGFTGRTAQTRSFVARRVADLEDKERAALLAGKGLYMVACVPLIAMDNVMGVMNLAADREIEFSEGSIDLLIAIGNQIAVAANNARLYEDLKGKVKELKIQKDAIEFFAFSISHDLKSPAIGIYGLTRRLYKEFHAGLGEKGNQYCEQILKASEQIVRLVDRINAYIMAREAPAHFEEIRIAEVVESIRNEFMDILNQRRVRLTAPAALPSIVADRLSITRVLRNLVDNALKYGGAEMSEIKIGYRPEAGYHVLWVSDNGVPLPDDDTEKLFQLFHRQKTSKGIEGTGLGLATVKSIAERHQGRAWIECRSPQGKTFCVSISKELEVNG